MKIHKLHLGRRNQPKYWPSVIILLGFIIIVGGFCRVVKVQAEDTANIQVKEQRQILMQVEKQKDDLIRLNEELKIQAENTKSPKLSEAQVRLLASLVIDKKADLDRFMTIITKCENGTLDPKRVNWNSNGLGYDLGVAQINSVFHSKRVQAIFGEDFDSAMGDSVKNIIYAGYIYQTQGNFSAWVCNSKV